MNVWIVLKDRGYDGLSVVSVYASQAMAVNEAVHLNAAEQERVRVAACGWDADEFIVETWEVHGT